MAFKKPRVFLNKYRIQEACKNKDMTLTRLAADIAGSSPTLYKWLDEGFEQEKAEEVSEILGYSIAQLSEKME